MYAALIFTESLSSTQCNWFSVPRYKRTAANICGAEAGELLIKVTGFLSRGIAGEPLTVNHANAVEIFHSG
ncbi:MAG: hypothetical protein QX199_07360 [Methylococcaceae bacterium]